MAVYMAVFGLQTSYQTQESIFSIWYYCILNACMVDKSDSLKKRKGGHTRLEWILYMHQYTCSKSVQIY